MICRGKVREIVTTAGLQTFVVIVKFFVGVKKKVIDKLLLIYYLLSSAHGILAKYIVAKN